MRRLIPLLLMCLLLCGCAKDPITPTSDANAPSDIPAPVVTDLPQNQDQVTLWFRFGTEPLLAPETRIITHARTESHALAILRALIGGPSAASTELSGLYPPGTQVISCTQSGRMMFVTLSKHIMNGYADEPADWRSRAAWAIEVPLRRELAMQAIAATLTENCGVDTVVILVEQTDTATDSLRLRQGYYALDGDMALADPLIRNEQLLLTPARTVDVILQCWQEGDFTRLYRYVARTDPDTGVARPEQDAFIQQMTAAMPLLYAQAEGGSITFGGQRAVFTIRGAYWDDGEERPFTGMVLQLVREKGVWRIGLTQLTGREALE